MGRVYCSVSSLNLSSKCFVPYCAFVEALACLFLRACVLLELSIVLLGDQQLLLLNMFLWSRESHWILVTGLVACARNTCTSQHDISWLYYVHPDRLQLKHWRLMEFLLAPRCMCRLSLIWSLAKHEFLVFSIEFAFRFGLTATRSRFVLHNVISLCLTRVIIPQLA